MLPIHEEIRGSAPQSTQPTPTFGPRQSSWAKCIRNIGGQKRHIRRVDERIK